MRIGGSAQLLDRQDPKPDQGQDDHRHLENDTAGQQGSGKEGVVLPGSQLGLELFAVEAEQEADRRRQHHEVGEDHAEQEEERGW